MRITIRPAATTDKDYIASWTTDTFEWGDYVSERFDSWLTDQRGLVSVAVHADGHQIGISRVVMLSDTEAWCHAARVHPDFRRSGIGSALHDYGLDWAVSQGALVSRLMVEDWNEPARAQVARNGYREVVKWMSATREVSIGDPLPEGAGLARASRAEVPAAWISWAGGELGIAARGFYSIGWFMRKMTVSDVESIAERGRLYQSQSGWAEVVLRDDEAWFPWMVAGAEDGKAMVGAAVNLAGRLPGAERIRLMFPAVSWMTDAASEHGFDLQPMSVFERPTQAS